MAHDGAAATLFDVFRVVLFGFRDGGVIGGGRVKVTRSPSCLCRDRHGNDASLRTVELWVSGSDGPCVQSRSRDHVISRLSHVSTLHGMMGDSVHGVSLSHG